MCDEIDISIYSPNYRNFRNQDIKKDDSTGEKNGYGKKQKEKIRRSRKIKCPRCDNYPLEIYNFVDENNNFVCNVYVCHKHNDTPSFFRREECDKI